MAGIYEDQGDLKKALKTYQASIIIREDMKDEKGRATCLNNIGHLYFNDGENALALQYYLESLAIRERISDKQGIVFSLTNIGTTYMEMEKMDQAIRYANRNFALAKELGYPRNIKDASKLMSQLYEKQNKGLKALEMYKLYLQMKDSINNESTQKASAKQQAKYEYEKQKTIDDAEHDKLLVIEQEEKEKQQILTGATACGLGLVIVFFIFVFNRLRVTKKQKIIIEEQKQEVEQQKEVVEMAHHELEEKNQEIMDSIIYAKRIQSAILPPAKVVKEYLKESFILYKPKDVVAGDFYWMEHKDNKVLFAAADCTGHGVPGAMVSVVCNNGLNGLNRAVREHGLTDPGEILTKTREIVIQEFEKSEEDVKDGMDIALCSLEGNKLQYAGAHNPLWIIRNGEIIETKANKQPIGQFDNPEPYTTHGFDLEVGDSLYIFSDGYVDQFGGEKGKKFKAKAFRSLLLSIQDKTMDEQKKIINEAFETWKGELEQIDDVCVIGVRI
jgi:serine phosphatase RsbU (regulator of sigma subunit)